MVLSVKLFKGIERPNKSRKEKNFSRSRITKNVSGRETTFVTFNNRPSKSISSIN